MKCIKNPTFPFSFANTENEYTPIITGTAPKSDTV